MNEENIKRISKILMEEFIVCSNSNELNEYLSILVKVVGYILHHVTDDKKSETIDEVCDIIRKYVKEFKEIEDEKKEN